MQRFDQVIVELLASVSGRTREEIASSIELPPQMEKGDRAVPCFRWAKEEGSSPPEYAARLKAKLTARSLPPEIERLEVLGGYLNFFVSKKMLMSTVLGEIAQHPGAFGFQPTRSDDVAVIEFSSPNIAKPFSIGHLRSTNIGACLSRIFAARGWRVVKINHLGDWGTQFGKLMVAYRRWGNAELLGSEPINNLYRLYVRFHEEEVSDATLAAEAREWFARLERGDSEAKELWDWFKGLTLQELKQLYETLGVEFNYYWGESFYTERIPSVLDALEAKGLSRVSEDATVVELEKWGLSTTVVKKSDDSSLYLTRDIAAAIYRFEQFRFRQMIYVVGAPQQLHFKQLFKILELLGYSWTASCEHVAFGHISFGDEGMSTRKGNVVFLSEVLKRAETLARDVVRGKNPDLENAEDVARAVGLGAVLFADLSSKRTKDVKFSWEEMLSFDGETGPYLQYTLVRTESLLRKHGSRPNPSASVEPLGANEEIALVRWLALFPMTLERAEKEREPFFLSQYLIELTKLFNRFYQAQRILDAPPEVREARMLLVSSVNDILKTGLSLLGIPLLEKM